MSAGKTAPTFNGPSVPHIAFRPRAATGEPSTHRSPGSGDAGWVKNGIAHFNICGKPQITTKRTEDSMPRKITVTFHGEESSDQVESCMSDLIWCIRYIMTNKRITKGD